MSHDPTDVLMQICKESSNLQRRGDIVLLNFSRACATTFFFNGSVSLSTQTIYLVPLRHNYESNQQDATIQVSLLFLVSSTCFGQCFRPSSGAFDYLQYLVVFKRVAAGWCQG